VKIAITGASGMIGRRLVRNLLAAGHAITVFSRKAPKVPTAGISIFAWDPVAGPVPLEALRGADAVVHLAGEPVAQRWTAEAKRRIRDSRVVGTRHLVESLAKLNEPPSILVGASAVGYYGSRGDELLREDAPAGSGYLPDVCEAWEHQTVAAETLGIRVARIRIGIVLDRGGGALQQMLPPFRMGVGGRLGDGRQWMSWIHLEDLASMLQYAVENPVRGVWNGVAPLPVTNGDFTRVLAEALHRPAIFPVPRFALKVFFGEMSEVLLASQRVVPAAAIAAGFPYRFPNLGGALRDVLGR